MATSIVIFTSDHSFLYESQLRTLHAMCRYLAYYYCINEWSATSSHKSDITKKYLYGFAANTIYFISFKTLLIYKLPLTYKTPRRCSLFPSTYQSLYFLLLNGRHQSQQNMCLSHLTPVAR